MTIFSTTRRQLLHYAGLLSSAALADMHLAPRLAALAQTAPATGYRALVCIYMFGGNDAHNTVLATDSASWSRYWTGRFTGFDPIALMPPGTAPTPLGGTNSVTRRTPDTYSMPETWGGVLPITPATANGSGRSYALNPHLAPLLPLWQSKRLAIVANVGPLIEPATQSQIRNKSVRVPAYLASHNDQQAYWQSGAVEGSKDGWGGVLADQFLPQNGANSLYTAVSTQGNAIWLAGKQVVQYQISTNQANPAPYISDIDGAERGMFGASGAGGRIAALLRDNSAAHLLVKDYAERMTRSIDTAGQLKAMFAQYGPGVPAPTAYVNPITRGSEANPLAIQLQSVAKMIASNATLGLKRQVFFVSINAFDTHNQQNQTHAVNMARLAHGMAYFDGVLGNLNGADMRSSVTTFTGSEFGRTFNTNGDGTDHAWGGHHFVMGGAVKGGDIYGRFPEVGADAGSFANPDYLDSMLIPVTSVDQYGGTLGRWLGIGDSQLDVIFPNLRNFNSNRYLGFI